MIDYVQRRAGGALGVDVNLGDRIIFGSETNYQDVDLVCGANIIRVLSNIPSVSSGIRPARVVWLSSQLPATSAVFALNGSYFISTFASLCKTACYAL